MRYFVLFNNNNNSLDIFCMFQQFSIYSVISVNNVATGRLFWSRSVDNQYSIK